MEEEVLQEVIRFLGSDFGNSGSRTHEFGAVANRAVENARRQVAQVVECDPAEVIFTSGATESDNLAILGLVDYGRRSQRTHIVSTEIEHKAVLEPLEELRNSGFEISLISPGDNGRVKSEDVLSAVRDDTLLVSVMHANNETGVIQPIDEISDGLAETDVYLHTDAAQTFGKELDGLRLQRIDMISVSGHKIFGPKGIGALIIRRRNEKRPPVEPLMYGGGQERGMRPGTMPVALVVGLGKAAEVAVRDHGARIEAVAAFRKALVRELGPLNPTIHGDQNHCMPHVLNMSFGDIDSEALMLAIKNEAAISNGSACTSAAYSPSHVLKAMNLTDDDMETATRWSWCHMTPEPDWAGIRHRLHMLM